MKDLIERLEKATGPDRELDGAIWCAVNGYEFLMWDGAGCCYMAKRRGWIAADHIKMFSASLDAALTLVPSGFYWTCGLCELSGHVTIGPDYNGSQRERLMREWPEDQYHEGFSEDLMPGDGIHRVCLAICIAALHAKSAQPSGAEVERG